MYDCLPLSGWRRGTDKKVRVLAVQAVAAPLWTPGSNPACMSQQQERIGHRQSCYALCGAVQCKDLYTVYLSRSDEILSKCCDRSYYYDIIFIYIRCQYFNRAADKSFIINHRMKYALIRDAGLSQ